MGSDSLHLDQNQLCPIPDIDLAYQSFRWAGIIVNSHHGRPETPHPVFGTEDALTNRQRRPMLLGSLRTCSSFVISR
jgi:hypothetical protein